MANIMTASQEYAARPADERLESFASMIAAAQSDREHSRECVYNVRDLRAEPATDGDGGIVLVSPKGRATFTHYSFGQLARTIQAPAGYLRSLPAQLTADCVNDGLQNRTITGTTANILIRLPNGDGRTLPTIRACTSETYGRVWDSSLYGEVDRWFGDGRKSVGGTWQSPPVWPGNPPGGQYRGDRDSFVLRIDGGSIVSDPRGWGAIGGDKGQLNRGIMIRNSEVGHSSIVVDWVLFDAVCGNHILWGAIIDRAFRRRHTGNKVTRDTISELIRGAREWGQRTASQDEQIIRSLVEHEIASTREGIVDELRKIGATKEQAESAYATAEQSESTFSPRSFWGISAAMTRDSQRSGYQDERFQLDSLAAAVLARGAKQYAYA